MSGFGTFIVVSYTALGLLAVGALFFFIRKWRWRWFLVTPLFVGVIGLAVAPFVEESVIESRFEEVCRDAGIHVVRKVEAQGFYDTTMRSGDSYINRLGFIFMEHPAPGDRRKIEHVEKVGGDWKRTIYERPTARYHLVESQANKAVGHKVRVQERVVIDTQTREVIARDTTYKRTANTINQAWMGLIGSTLRLCPDPSKGPPRGDLVDQTIIPIKR